jgi:hypothetical protein
MALTGDALIEIPQELVESFGGLITILKALGWMVIFYILFNVINALINKRKQKQLEQLGSDVKEIKEILKRKKKT